MKLSFITPIAYDFRYAKHAISAYYDIADEIILGLDEDRMSWSKEQFFVHLGELHDFVNRLDTKNKIRVVEDDFHSSATPMENETYERNKLSRHATGDWIVSIDSDEIVQNPEEFRCWLQDNTPIIWNCQLTARLMTVFKTFPGDIALLPVPPYEAALVATMARGAYVKARMTDQLRVQSPLSILHYGWGRTRAELEEKCKHWGHSGDFNTAEFLKFWDSIDLGTYAVASDFHPLRPKMWSVLEARAGIKALE